MNFIFDLDGTLIDSALGIYYSLDLTIRQVFPDFDPGTLDLKIGPFPREIMSKAIRGVTEQELNELEVTFDRVYSSEGWKMAALYPQVRETLGELTQRDIHIYLVTNKLRLPTGLILSYFGLAPFFLEIACPDSHIPTFKNKTESLQYLLNRCNLNADESIYIGDSPDDLSSAKACGIAFIGLQYGYGTFHNIERSIPILNSFQELLETNIFRSHMQKIICGGTFPLVVKDISNSHQR